jgi:hypothetical protein
LRRWLCPGEVGAVLCFDASADLMVLALEIEGVECIFGVPGEDSWSNRCDEKT